MVEIGAGLGAHDPLVDRATQVVAIERDRELVPVLHGVGETIEAGS